MIKSQVGFFLEYPEGRENMNISFSDSILEDILNRDFDK